MLIIDCRILCIGIHNRHLSLKQLNVMGFDVWSLGVFEKTLGGGHVTGHLPGLRKSQPPAHRVG